MQSVSFALVCVAAQAVFVSAHSAAAARGGEESASEFHEEFIKAGTQLQADLKTAFARADFKRDNHLQAALNGIEEADKKLVLIEKDLMDPKHPMSQSEGEKLGNDFFKLEEKIKSEAKLVRPEFRNDQLLKQIGQNFGTRIGLVQALALKQGSQSAKQFTEVKGTHFF